MAKDYAASFEPVVRPVLADGERLLAASPLFADPGTSEDVAVGDELRNLLDPTILLGLGSHPGNLMQRAAFGRAVTGDAGSIARAVFDAVARVQAPHLAVTNTRLLVLDIDLVPRKSGILKWFGDVDQTIRSMFEVDRGCILGAVAAPAGVLRRGRFLVGFSDGSGCVLVCATPSLRDRAVATLKPGE